MNATRDCSKDPCETCTRREAGQTCGDCTAGILIGMNGNHIERCDACALFEDDEDAVAAMQALATLLHQTYLDGLKRGPFTVADALDRIVQQGPERRALRERSAKAWRKAARR